MKYFIGYILLFCIGVGFGQSNTQNCPTFPTTLYFDTACYMHAPAELQLGQGQVQADRYTVIMALKEPLLEQYISPVIDLSGQSPQFTVGS